VAPGIPVNQQDAAQEVLGLVKEVEQAIAQTNNQVQQGGSGNTCKSTNCSSFSGLKEAEQILQQIKK